MLFLVVWTMSKTLSNDDSRNNAETVAWGDEEANKETISS